MCKTSSEPFTETEVRSDDVLRSFLTQSSEIFSRESAAAQFQHLQLADVLHVDSQSFQRSTEQIIPGEIQHLQLGKEQQQGSCWRNKSLSNDTREEIWLKSESDLSPSSSTSVAVRSQWLRLRLWLSGVLPSFWTNCVTRPHPTTEQISESSLLSEDEGL